MFDRVVNSCQVGTIDFVLSVDQTFWHESFALAHYLRQVGNYFA